MRPRKSYRLRAARGIPGNGSFSDLRAGVVKGYAVNSFSPAPRKPSADAICLCPRCKEPSFARGEPTSDPGITERYCGKCERKLAAVESYREQCAQIANEQRKQTLRKLAVLRLAVSA